MTRAILFIGASISLAALASCGGGAPSTKEEKSTAAANKSDSPEKTESKRSTATSEPKKIEFTSDKPKKAMSETPQTPDNDQSNKSEIALATFGAGCFWCVEAVFERIPGVSKVESGYMGGKTLNPTYKDICTGTTGHAEGGQLTYDPKTVSFDTRVEWFWKLHDPTTLNRQGNDVGTQYRSAIFYHTPEQKEIAEKLKKAEDASGRHADPIVTEIAKAAKFYVAENYHQDYFELNKFQPYCQGIIVPKLIKLGFDR